MAKKKTKKVAPKQLSPENYIRTKARTLPIVECIVEGDWENLGLCHAVVARQHSNGNYTIGVYLLDTFCLGVKDSFYRFNCTVEEYMELREKFTANFGEFSTQDYEYTHNLIWGAVAYAADLGIAPHSSFNLTQYILEADDEQQIPIQEFEYGCAGEPTLVVSSKSEARKYVGKLIESVGEDFSIIIDEDEYSPSEFMEAEFENKIDFTYSDRLNKRKTAMPTTVYRYVTPDYDIDGELINGEKITNFVEMDFDKISKADIDAVLSLDANTLVSDVNTLLTRELGLFSRDLVEDEDYERMAAILLLMGHLGDERSLPYLLELLRQDEEFSEYYFCDILHEILVPVIYSVAKGNLAALFEYIKEPGLYVYLRSTVFEAVTMVAVEEHSRRAEVIEWYAQVIDLYIENITNSDIYDATLAALAISDLMCLKAVELLPQIEKLYATNKVDIGVCGSYNDVVKYMKVGGSFDYKKQNIYDTFTQFQN